jgi:amidase
VSPAERSGVVGFKLTRGVIPSGGLIFASERLDTVGLLTRTITDAVKVLQEIVRHSVNDSQRKERDILRQSLNFSISNAYLSGLRIGIPSSFADLENIHPAKHQAFKRALYLFEAVGGDIVQGIDILGAEEYANLPPSHKHILLDTDMKQAINNYLANLATNPQNIHNLQDLITFTKAHPEEEYPQRNVAVLERALATDPADELYKQMLAKDEWFKGGGGIEGALKRHKLSILLIPMLSPTLNAFTSKAGSPCLSIPMGKYPAGTDVECDPGNGLVNVAPGIP